MATSFIPEGIYSTEVLKTGGRSLNERERYKEALQLLSVAASSISLCGGKQYASRMKAVDTMLNIWLRGKEVMVLEANADGTVLINVSADNETAADSNIGMCV